MAYLHSYGEWPVLGDVGCGPDCSCGKRRKQAGLAETYEREEEDEPGTKGWGGFAEPALRQDESASVRAAIVSGMRDENRLTDLLFHRRRPELRGRRIQPGETALVREWREIRDRLVRPALVPPTPRGAAGPRPAPPGVQPGARCAKEDPLRESVHRPGTPCGPDGRKCWPRQASLDILDSDMPCNGEEQRSAAAYSAVLDYFNVGHPANQRYARQGNRTYCNIYAHDATRAMRASIPHWIQDPRQTRDPPRGWNELNANATFDWLVRSGAANGWVQIDAPLVDWLNQQFNRRQSLPFPGGQLPQRLIAAGGRISALSHRDPALLRQDSYVAQQFANLGHPTVVVWKNPRGGPGHIAMVRPETPARQGAVHHSGVFLPRSAQAGARNFDNELATWILSARARLFFVHA
jgi:hypothetical protein